MNTYLIGDKIRCQGSFTVSGSATDPTTITFKLKDPAGTTTTYVYGVDAQLVKSSTGVYYVDVLPDQTGIYGWCFLGTGPAYVAEDQQFLVANRAA